MPHFPFRRLCLHANSSDPPRQPRRILRKPIACGGDPPCGRAHCSPCTLAFVGRIWPQMEARLSTGTWLPFTLIAPFQRFSETGLARASFDRCERALKSKFRDHGLTGIPILAALDVNREDFYVGGRLVRSLFVVHVHGFMQIVRDQQEIDRLMRRAFPPHPEVKEPFRFHKPGSPFGWAVYTLKDPARIKKRVHDDRYRRAKKFQMSAREAGPIMDFLARHRGKDRMFLQGFKLLGHERLVPIRSFGRWTPSSNAQGPNLGTQSRGQKWPKGPQNGLRRAEKNSSA